MQKTVNGKLLAVVLFIAVHPEPVRVVHGREVTIRAMKTKSREWLENYLRGQWTRQHNDDEVNLQLANELRTKLGVYDYSHTYATFVWNNAGADATLYTKGEGNSVTDVPDKVQALTRASFNVTELEDDFRVIRDAAVFLLPLSLNPPDPPLRRQLDYVSGGALCTECARDQPFPVDLDAVAVCIRERFGAHEPPFPALVAVLVFGNPWEGIHLRFVVRDGHLILFPCVVEHHERRADLTIAILPGAE